MKDCIKAKELLVDFVYNEAGKEDRAFVESHIKTCDSCAVELEKIRKVASAASSMKAELPQHMWDMHLKSIMKSFQKQNKKKVWFDFGIKARAFAAGFAVFLMAAVGTIIYFGHFERLFNGKNRELKMAENLDMIQNIEIIERLEFYKTMAEKLCEKEPC